VTPRPFSFAPGPTEIHPAARTELRALADDGYASESHRSAPVRREVERLSEALSALLRIPEGHRILLVGSATEAMERIVDGAARSRSFHLVNGAFARRFRDVARAAGLEVGDAEVPDGASFRGSLGEGPTALPAGTELLALTQNETSNGARIPPPDVHALAGQAREAGALVAADLVTGWPTEPVDPGVLDAGFFSVQKGFGLPPGLGVIVASPALVERARSLRGERLATPGRPAGGYLHLAALADAADRHETVATPNTVAIRLLARVAEAFLDEGGQDALSARAEAAFRRWWAEVARLGAASEARGGPGLAPFVAAEEIRSRTVAVVSVTSPTPDDDRPADRIRAALRDRGLVVGDGYGPGKGRHLRVAHFPVQTDEAQARLLEALAEVLLGSHVSAR
jgi:phosphoserine aminotransferase